MAFTVCVADVPEQVLPGESPTSHVQRLAREKAEAIDAPPGSLVLGADTVVVVDGEILGKPSDDADARRMLRLLSGRRHVVTTGFCLRRASGDETESVCELGTESTTVQFAPLTDAEIDAYVATGEPRDKAGAYAIQGLASKFIERVEGCYFNVVGLPMARVYRCLTRRREESGEIR